jgi:ribose/xylose/arabinose/galactoside ABC-type transport system permease subunit
VDNKVKGLTARTFFQKYQIFVIFAVMVLFFSIMRRQYFTPSNLISILIQAGMLGIVSIGMTLVIMTGGADMSVGAVAGASTLAALWWVVNGNMPYGTGLILGFGVALLIGTINGFCVARLGIAPFVVTLGTMFLAQGSQYMFSQGGMNISYGFPRAFLLLGRGRFAGIPMPIVIFVVIFLLSLFLTEQTPLGRYIKGTGYNQFAAELSGIRIRLNVFLVYVFSSLLAAILGLVLCAFQQFVSPDHGNSFLMDSLLVTLLGKALLDGKTTVYGTAFGALLLRSFETGLAMMGLPVTVLSVSKGALLVAVLLLNLIKQKRMEGRTE